MIEPTDEMRDAQDRAIEAAGDDGTAEGGERAQRAGLAAVLALLARDYCLQPRGHVWHPLAREWPLNCGGMHPHYCASCSDGHAKGDGCLHCRQTGYDQTPWPHCGSCTP